LEESFKIAVRVENCQIAIDNDAIRIVGLKENVDKGMYMYAVLCM
jgi:hypothetical protein